MSHKIAVVAGDGIGPEVTAAALKVLESVAGRFGIAYETVEYPFGTDHWLATGGTNGGETLPDSAFADIQKMDAVLLGAIGDPRAPVGLVEHGVIMRMRVGLDLYVNLRPVKLYDERLCPLKDKKPEDVDMVIVRENTEDAYTASPEFTDKGTPDEVAMQPMRYTHKGTVRVIRDPRRAELKQGEILVAESTDPGWIMLFPLASAIIVERGSPLSHSAIVARELGIPAVVALEGATDWLRDGDQVHMDGSNGVVRKLKKTENHP